jgi:hypothetical protein
MDNVTLDETWGKPFGTAWNEPRELVQLRGYIREFGASIEDNQFIEHFMAGVQGAFNLYASKLAYNAGAYDYRGFWEINDPHERDKAYKQFQDEQLAKRVEIVRNIDDKSFRKSLTNMLLTSAGIKTGTVKKPWGQFMPTLPCNYITD